MADPRNAPVIGSLYAEVKGHLDAGDLQQALECAEQAVMEGRDHGVAIFTIAAVSYRRGLIGSAIQLLLELTEAGEIYSDSHESLAVLYCLAGSLPKALYHGKEATILVADGYFLTLFGQDFPKFNEALANISEKPLIRAGQAALGRGDFVSAILCIEQHLIVEPNEMAGIDLYATALMLNGQSAKALGMLRSLVTLAGHKPTLLSRIGACLVSMGRLDQGLANHRAALSDAPNSIALWGAAVADLVNVPQGRSDAAEIINKWQECILANAVKSPRPAPAVGRPERVVIAFLSRCRRTPIEMEMLSNIILNLDKSRIGTLGLGRDELNAPHNAAYRGLFDRWRNVGELDVLTLGALVRGEAVTFLIDLDGLNDPARAGLFLRNCAPLQATWLNAPVHGRVPGASLEIVAVASGAEDEVVIPGGRYLFDVAPFRLGPPPSLSEQGGFTFGVDASMAQISADSVAQWSQVLAALPGTTLVLRDHGQFGEQENVSMVIELFGNLGMAHRIDVIAAELPEFAAQVDVMLAPATDLDVLSHGRLVGAGVPVLLWSNGARAVDLKVALQSTDLARHMLAVDRADWVEHARFWSQNPELLAKFRAQAQDFLASSPAFDRKAYARGLGEALLGYVDKLSQGGI